MAARDPDLSDPKVRDQIRKERKKMDCKGIYKGTARDINASIEVFKYFKAALGFETQVLATLTERATIIGQARYELCQLYKSTPEFGYKEYLAQADKNNAMLVRLFELAETAQTVVAQSKDEVIGKSAEFKERKKALKQDLEDLDQEMGKYIEKKEGLVDKKIALAKKAQQALPA